MTSTQHRMLKTRFAKAILWITLFSMAGGSLLFSPNLFKRFSGGVPKIATVDGSAISINEFKLKISQESERIAFIRQQMGPQADYMMRMMGISDDPKVMAIQALIVEKVLDKVANDLGIYVSSDFIARKMQDPYFVLQELRDSVPLSVIDQRGTISVPMLRYYLQAHGVSFKDFEESLENALRRSLTRNLILLSSYISTDELKKAFTDQVLEREYGVLIFNLDTYLKTVKAKPLSNDELESFLTEQNKIMKRYWSPEKRSARVWEFKPETFGVVINDQDIEKYYTDHKQEYLESPVQIQIRRIMLKVDDKNPMTQLQEKAQKIKEELAAHPDRFAQLAQQYSQDSATALKGGMVGFIKRGDLEDQAIERAAFRLQNDGDVSDALSTNQGIELIQRVARKSASYKSLASVKNDIKALLLKQKFDEQFTRETRSALNQLRSSGDALEKLSKERNGSARIANVSRRDTSLLSQRIFKTPHNEQTFFIDDKGTGVIVQTTQIEKSVEVPLETVKKQVEDDLYYDKARQAMKVAIKQAAEKAKTTQLSSLKTEFGATFESTGMFNQHDEKSVKKLEEKNLPISNLLSLTQQGAVTSTDQGDRGYVLKLEKRQPFDQALFMQKKQEVVAQLEQEKKERIYRGYIASLCRNATIKITPDNELSTERVPLEDLPS
ncbi:MAG: Peptidyl-prolyl cis-trans isomerase D [Candidatus Dependentiae bacterium ADurb.Bin331]|nr:MAG: Peptidyl-prolyl cis-trans isomerase D [Candidatus Dependentiae bacterium ADurb.Bin331]